jgi:hypothetical protein
VPGCVVNDAVPNTVPRSPAALNAAEITGSASPSAVRCVTVTWRIEPTASVTSRANLARSAASGAEDRVSHSASCAGITVHADSTAAIVCVSIESWTSDCSAPRSQPSSTRIVVPTATPAIASPCPERSPSDERTRWIATSPSTIAATAVSGHQPRTMAVSRLASASGSSRVRRVVCSAAMGGAG